MTYQPKSYRKFVATAATATLVATAFAPFASAHSFKDVETKYEEAVNFLVSKGVSGYPDGTFKTQKTITRLEAAEMLGKALGLDKVTDAPVSGFTDVPARVATLINAFKAKGITSGKTATTFAPNAEITRGELAVWIQKAYDLKAKEGSTNKFTDVADNYKAAVQAFVDNKIASGTSETTFGTTTSAKRGDFALFVKRAADAAVVKEVAVESVSAINEKQVKLVGQSLDQLKAEQFTLEGNKVLTYVASEDKKEAIITFEKAVPSAVEQTLKLTQKVEGEADVVTEFKFTFTLDVKSAKAVTTRIDETKDAQFLKFSINGESTTTDVDYLKAAGYTVKFQSTKIAVLADDTTGEIDEAEINAGDKFAYKVVITKDNVTVETELVEVTVVDSASVTTAITKSELLTNTDVVVKSGKLVVGEVASLSNIEGTLLDGTKEASITDATFKTSNPKVAVIDSAGEITPITPGTVTFTIESGDAKKEVEVTVVADARKETTVTTNISSAKLVNSATKNVTLEVKDQYGDSVKGFDLDAITVENSKKEEIAKTTNPAATDKEGKTSFVITADQTNVGTGKLEIKDSKDKILASINLTIAVAGDVAERKVELADATKDLSLDIVKGSDDTEVVVNWNQYNAAGFLIGAEKDYTARTGKYTVASSDTDIANVTADDSTGEITVAAGTKSGTATIKIMEGSVVRDSFKVTVVDSTPVITDVTFENVEVTTAKALGLKTEVIKPENVKINAEKTVSISDDGVIYIEVANSGYNANDDITLGYVSAVSNVKNSSGKTVPVAIASGNLGTTAGAAFSAGDNGEIVVKVVRTNETTPVAVSTINVNVK